MTDVTARALGAVFLIGVLAPQRVAAQTPVSALGSCAGQNLSSFTIRGARLNDPFGMLRWRKPSAAILDAVTRLQGETYSFATVDAVSRQIESERWLPDSTDALVTAAYSDIGLENCREQQLDVVFTVFSAAISPTLTALFEWNSPQRTANETAGIAQANAAWQFAPQAVFDQALRLTAGGRTRGTWKNSHLPFEALEVQALGSTESHTVSGSLVGGHDSATAWLRRANWQVAFEDASTPTGSDHLENRSWGGQFSVTSKPMKGVVARFGGVLSGGHLESDFAASSLPPQTVASSDFTAATVAAGVTARGRQQAFSASYALVLGSTGNGFHGSWRTHFGDLAHSIWLPFSDHRVLEVDQRLTMGQLQVVDAVPVSERFFGGANENPLVLGDDWRIRVNPIIRSIPTNGLSLTATGVGGDQFVAYNSTTAVTVWNTPVVPRELGDDEAFNKALQGQLTSARSTLDTVFRSDDPHFRTIQARMPEILSTLNRVSAAEMSARSLGALPPSEFETCEDALQASRSAAEKVIADKPVQAFGWVIEMLPDGGSALNDVVSTCGTDLVATLRNAGGMTSNLESATADLARLASDAEMTFATIDTRKSAARAAEDMGFAEHALDVIMKQLNVTSVSPVFVFDVAHLGPAVNDAYGGTRYAVGGGVRLTLLSTVSFTATYAVNPHRRPGESSGALVFSLTTRDLFQ